MKTVFHANKELVDYVNREIETLNNKLAKGESVYFPQHLHMSDSEANHYANIFTIGLTDGVDAEISAQSDDKTAWIEVKWYKGEKQLGIVKSNRVDGTFKCPSSALFDFVVSAE